MAYLDQMYGKPNTNQLTGNPAYQPGGALGGPTHQPVNQYGNALGGTTAKSYYPGMSDIASDYGAPQVSYGQDPNRQQNHGPRFYDGIPREVNGWSGGEQDPRAGMKKPAAPYQAPTPAPGYTPGMTGPPQGYSPIREMAGGAQLMRGPDGKNYIFKGGPGGYMEEDAVMQHYSSSGMPGQGGNFSQFRAGAGGDNDPGPMFGGQNNSGVMPYDPEEVARIVAATGQTTGNIDQAGGPQTAPEWMQHDGAAKWMDPVVKTTLGAMMGYGALGAAGMLGANAGGLGGASYGMTLPGLGAGGSGWGAGLATGAAGTGVGTGGSLLGELMAGGLGTGQGASAIGATGTGLLPTGAAGTLGAGAGVSGAGAAGGLAATGAAGTLGGTFGGLTQIAPVAGATGGMLGGVGGYGAIGSAAAGAGGSTASTMSQIQDYVKKGMSVIEAIQKVTGGGAGGKGGGAGILDMLGAYYSSQQMKDYSGNMKGIYSDLNNRQDQFRNQLLKSYEDPNQFYGSNQWKGLESVYQNSIDRDASKAGRLANPTDREVLLQNHAMKELEKYRDGLRQSAGLTRPEAALEPLAKGYEAEAYANTAPWATAGRGGTGGGSVGQVRDIVGAIGDTAKSAEDIWKLIEGWFN